MAPFDPQTSLGWLGAGLLSLGIGFAFGFVLERAGFGNARKLAAQFYFHDMTVLKVMFTGIVVCLLLLSISVGVGLVDAAHLAVHETYLWPGILGGFILGLGFIVGGYCPGTSLVSAATGKIDGLLFALGVILGIFVFSETVDGYAAFWHHSGHYGRITLPGILGVNPGWVVAAIALGAVAVFVVVERVERFLSSTPAQPRVLPRYVKAGAVAVVVLAMGALAIGQPDARARASRMDGELQAALDSRAYHIDPAELATLMENRRIRLVILDARSDADFNLFHLRDAERLPPNDYDSPRLKRLPDATVKVVVSNDERGAEIAWKVLRGANVANVYLLDGGINGWLETFGGERVEALDLAETDAPERLRWAFPAATGSDHPSATASADLIAKRPFETKVKIVLPKAASGGCG